MYYHLYHNCVYLVCDAKVNFDDNAEFRQKEVFKLRDRSQEDPREVEASKHDLNYIGLTGIYLLLLLLLSCGGVCFVQTVL